MVLPLVHAQGHGARCWTSRNEVYMNIYFSETFARTLKLISISVYIQPITFIYRILKLLSLFIYDTPHTRLLSLVLALMSFFFFFNRFTLSENKNKMKINGMMICAI